MHYIINQEVLGGKYVIHLIQYDNNRNTIKIWIQKNDEVVLWKEFSPSMPIAVEYNINF